MGKIQLDPSKEISWATEQVPDDLVALINDSPPDIMAAVLAGKESFDKSNEAFEQRLESYKDALKRESIDLGLLDDIFPRGVDLDTVEGYQKGNPVKHASMDYMNLHDGSQVKSSELYFGVETFLRVMRKLPITLWINGKIPYESPITVRSRVQEIFISPSEKGAEITGITSDCDMEFRELMSARPSDGIGHQTYVEGIPKLTFMYNPASVGVRNYQHKGHPGEMKDSVDDPLILSIYLKHMDSLVTEERIL
ncbi:MAG: hypothetical protein V3V78_02380 [Candidatus Woesearchaeota archaeon]